MAVASHLMKIIKQFYSRKSLWIALVVIHVIIRVDVGLSSYTGCGVLVQASWCNNGDIIMLSDTTSAASCRDKCNEYISEYFLTSGGCCNWYSYGSTGDGAYTLYACHISDGGTETAWRDDSRKYWSSAFSAYSAPTSQPSSHPPSQPS